MKKIVCIGECSLNIIYGADGQPQGSMPGGRLVNAAAIIAREGFEVVFASEASADKVGDVIVDFLSKSGVDVKSVDRFTDGRSPLNLLFPDGEEDYSLERYQQYSIEEEGFDIIWPRVEEGDIVIYGGYYAIDERVHPRLSKFLEHASEMKAVLVYLPGFPEAMVPRITRVMPAVLENLEYADIVVTRGADLKMIFGACTGAECYDKHIDFYCRSLININFNDKQVEYFGGKEVTNATITDSNLKSLLWQSGSVAGLAETLLKEGTKKELLDAPEVSLREKILRGMLTKAHAVEVSVVDKWRLCP